MRCVVVFLLTTKALGGPLLLTLTKSLEIVNCTTPNSLSFPYYYIKFFIPLALPFGY